MASEGNRWENNSMIASYDEVSGKILGVLPGESGERAKGQEKKKPVNAGAYVPPPPSKLQMIKTFKPRLGGVFYEYIGYVMALVYLSACKSEGSKNTVFTSGRFSFKTSLFYKPSVC